MAKYVEKVYDEWDFAELPQKEAIHVLVILARNVMQVPCEGGDYVKVRKVGSMFEIYSAGHKGDYMVYPFTDTCSSGRLCYVLESSKND